MTWDTLHGPRATLASMPKCGTSSLGGQHQRGQGAGWWGVLRAPGPWYRSFWGHLLMHGGWPCVARYGVAEGMPYADAVRALVTLDDLGGPADHLWSPAGRRIVPGGLWSQHVAWWWTTLPEAPYSDRWGDEPPEVGWTVDRLVGMADLARDGGTPREHAGPVEGLPVLDLGGDRWMAEKVRARWPEAWGLANR